MRNHWTRETIIRQLLERQSNKLPLTVGGQGVDISLYGAARRIFGSWRNAIQAAGIAPQQVLTWERWSPAQILVMIRHLARRDRPLTTYQIERRYHNLVSAARRHFGSWAKAVLAAGVEPTRLQRVVPWNPDRVIEAILTRALRNESLAARVVEPRSLLEAGQRFFGDWPAAVSTAGLDVALTVLPPSHNKSPCPPKVHGKRGKFARTTRRFWNKERVIVALQKRLHEQKPMNAAAIVRDNQSLAHAMRRYLGSWAEAMRAAGLDPDAYRCGPNRGTLPADAKLREFPPQPSQNNALLRLDHPP